MGWLALEMLLGSVDGQSSGSGWLWIVLSLLLLLSLLQESLGQFPRLVAEITQAGVALRTFRVCSLFEGTTLHLGTFNTLMTNLADGHMPWVLLWGMPNDLLPKRGVLGI